MCRHGDSARQLTFIAPTIALRHLIWRYRQLMLRYRFEHHAVAREAAVRVGLHPGHDHHVLVDSDVVRQPSCEVSATWVGGHARWKSNKHTA